jgi:hypothetical protein
VHAAQRIDSFSMVLLLVDQIWPLFEQIRFLNHLNNNNPTGAKRSFQQFVAEKKKRIAPTMARTGGCKRERKGENERERERERHRERKRECVFVCERERERERERVR